MNRTTAGYSAFKASSHKDNLNTYDCSLLFVFGRMQATVTFRQGVWFSWAMVGWLVGFLC